jgi:hypothetical protein
LRTHDGRQVVVERVIRESGSSGSWLQLTKANYDAWSQLMKLQLEARNLWGAIEHERVYFHDDRTTP